MGLCSGSLCAGELKVQVGPGFLHIMGIICKCGIVAESVQFCIENSSYPKTGLAFAQGFWEVNFELLGVMAKECVCLPEGLGPPQIKRGL